jgi:hypothetical protein
MAEVNDKIVKLIKARLEKGHEEYKRDVPIRRERNLSNIDEAVDEVLDLVVYLTAYTLELQADREEKATKSMSIMDIHLLLKGLHMLHSEAWKENAQSSANEIYQLINRIKEGCKWGHEDDKLLGQTDNPINKEMTTEDVTGPTKCITGSNCD